VQTASRAVGVAQNALELGLGYALERNQFAESWSPSAVSHKLAMMVVETMVARQLTYFAAREKDSGRRCDIEPGWPSCGGGGSPGPTPTTRCRSTAATAMRSSTR